MKRYMRIRASPSGIDVVCCIDRHEEAYAVLILKDPRQTLHVGSWVRMFVPDWARGVEERTRVSLVEL